MFLHQIILAYFAYYITGMYHAGICFRQLESIFTALGIPMMSKVCWKVHENALAEKVTVVAKRSCDKALAAETEATRIKT